jgi:hypothetical protein
MEFIDLNDNLRQAVEEAEQYAIMNIQSGVTINPYISLGENKIQKIIAEDIDTAIEVANEEIEDLNTETVVFIYEDTIELADGNCQAIVSQLFNEDEDNGYSFGLAYKIEDKKIVFLNNRVFLGNIRNCLVY